MEKITNEIFRLKVPFEDVYTSVFFIKTDSGLVVFDTATYDTDAENYIVPAIKELGFAIDDVKYIFISHNHRDHSGGMKKLISYAKNAVIVAKDESFKDKFPETPFIYATDGLSIAEKLNIVDIPGHSTDSTALFDTRTKALITGDCLQLYGLYGSGNWGANIKNIKSHFEALKKLKTIDIDLICTSHDYHPMGNNYQGKEEIFKAYNLCVQPLYEIKQLIDENPDADDKNIAEIYNKRGLPAIGTWVSKAVREYNGEFNTN